MFGFTKKSKQNNENTENKDTQDDESTENKDESGTNAVVERWFSQKRTVIYAGWPNAIQLPQE